MRYLLKVKVFQFEPLPLNQNQPMEIDVQDSNRSFPLQKSKGNLGHGDLPKAGAARSR